MNFRSLLIAALEWLGNALVIAAAIAMLAMFGAPEFALHYLGRLFHG